MPCSMFNVLYTIAFEKMKSEEGKQQAQADAIEDTIEDIS